MWITLLYMDFYNYYAYVPFNFLFLLYYGLPLGFVSRHDIFICGNIYNPLCIVYLFIGYLVSYSVLYNVQRFGSFCCVDLLCT